MLGLGYVRVPEDPKKMPEVFNFKWVRLKFERKHVHTKCKHTWELFAYFEHLGLGLDSNEDFQCSYRHGTMQNVILYPVKQVSKELDNPLILYDFF
jgi:hypothetical protein